MHANLRIDTLPIDVLSRVVAHLPAKYVEGRAEVNVANILSLRLVCHFWQNVLASPGVLQFPRLTFTLNLAKHPLHHRWFAQVLGAGVTRLLVAMDNTVVSLPTGSSIQPHMPLLRELLPLLTSIQELIICCNVHLDHFGDLNELLHLCPRSLTSLGNHKYNRPLAYEDCYMISQICPQLQRVQLPEAMPLVALACFRELRELQLNHVHNSDITGANLQQVFQSCGHLTSIEKIDMMTASEAAIDFRGLTAVAPHVTDIFINFRDFDVLGLDSLLRACPSLTSLRLENADVAQCVAAAPKLHTLTLNAVGLDDAKLEVVLASQNRLSELHLQHEDSLTPSALQSISHHLAGSLRELGLYRLTASLYLPDTLRNLVRACPKLSSLYLTLGVEYGEHGFDAFDEIHIDGVAWMFHTLERRLNRVFRACGRKGKVEIDTEIRVLR